MKYGIGIIIALATGGIIGLFGVIVSVFADSAMSERMVSIAAIWVIYAILGGAWGIALPKYSWKWGLLIGAPGVIFLGVYMLSEFNIFFPVYMILILCFSCFGAWGGNYIRNRSKSS